MGLPRRAPEELVTVERIAQLAEGVGATPRYIRDHVRRHHAMDAITRLVAIGMGDETFPTKVKEVVSRKQGRGKAAETKYFVAEKIVDLPASPEAQIAALKAVVAVGVPTGAGTSEGGGDNALPGIIALPALDFATVQALAHVKLAAAEQVAVIDAPGAAEEAARRGRK